MLICSGRYLNVSRLYRNVSGDVAAWVLRERPEVNRYISTSESGLPARIAPVFLKVKGIEMRKSSLRAPIGSDNGSICSKETVGFYLIPVNLLRRDRQSI